MSNPCDKCYEMRQPHTTKCPACGKDTYVGQVVGICSIWKCSLCGDGVVSAGGFPPACLNEEKYELIIGKPKDTKSMVDLSRILNRRVLDLNRDFSSSSELTVSLKLMDCVKTYKAVISIGIPCKLDHLLLKNYSRVLDCSYYGNI